MARQSNRILWAKKLAGETLPSSTHLPLAKKPYRGVVLGIDPSLRGTGLALIEYKSSHEVILYTSQTVKVPASKPMSYCLRQIHDAIAEMIVIKKVRHVAMEGTIYVQNFQTAQIMGAARGAAMVAAALADCDVFEYAPLRIKQAVVGYGRASKSQVAKTVKQHFRHDHELPCDEADAAAVALCHAFTWAGE